MSEFLNNTHKDIHFKKNYRINSLELINTLKKKTQKGFSSLLHCIIIVTASKAGTWDTTFMNYMFFLLFYFF